MECNKEMYFISAKVRGIEKSYILEIRNHFFSL